MKKDKLPPVAHKLGQIKTVEGVIDVIEHVLSVKELIGRDFDEIEIAAFHWIETAANLPSFKQQSRHLPENQQDRLAEMLSELEQALHPEEQEGALTDGEQVGGGLFLFDECMN